MNNNAYGIWSDLYVAVSWGVFAASLAGLASIILGGYLGWRYQRTFGKSLHPIFADDLSYNMAHFHVAGAVLVLIGFVHTYWTPSDIGAFHHLFGLTGKAPGYGLIVLGIASIGTSYFCSTYSGGYDGLVIGPLFGVLIAGMIWSLSLDVLGIGVIVLTFLIIIPASLGLAWFTWMMWGVWEDRFWSASHNRWPG